MRILGRYAAILLFTMALVLTGCGGSSSSDSSGGGGTTDNSTDNGTDPIDNGTDPIDNGTDNSTDNTTVSYLVQGPYNGITFIAEGVNDNRTWFEEYSMVDAAPNTPDDGGTYTTTFFANSLDELDLTPESETYGTTADNGSFTFTYNNGGIDMTGTRSSDNMSFTGGTAVTGDPGGDSIQSVHFAVHFDDSLRIGDLTGDFHVFYIGGSDNDTSMKTGRFFWNFGGGADDTNGIVTINNTNDGGEWSGDQSNPLENVVPANQFNYTMDSADDGRLLLDMVDTDFTGTVAPDGSMFYARFDVTNAGGGGYNNGDEYTNNGILIGIKVPTDAELADGQALLEGTWIQQQVCTKPAEVHENTNVIELDATGTVVGGSDGLTISDDTASANAKGLIDATGDQVGAIAIGAEVWVRVNDVVNSGGDRCFDVATKLH